jgi:two-component system phosphate regulon response regulator PhoB
MPGIMATPRDQSACNARILIIDGDAVFANILSTVLRDNGFDIVKSSTGKEALRLLEEDVFHIVLSDADLPDNTGTAICRHLRKNPRLRNMPVILMSGGLEEEQRRRAFESGATDFLSKPFKINAMVARVLACLEQ